MWIQQFESADVPRFLTERNGFLVADELDERSLASGRFRVFRTEDGGDSWEPCGTGISYKPVHTSSTGRRSAHSIVLQRDSDRWVQELRSTSDLGCHWGSRSVQLPEDPDESFSSIHFATSQLGWIGGSANGSLYRTTDGGASWKPLDVPSGHHRIVDLYFRDQSNGWVISLDADYDNKQMYFTRDGGRTWVPYTLGGADAPPLTWAAGFLQRFLTASKY